MESIDYEALKARGFLRQKHEGYFILRARMSEGVYKKDAILKLAEIADNFGKGFLHATVRQGLEIPWIKFEDIDRVEAQLKSAGLKTGTSGPRLRATTCCPGNNWCKAGLVNTFSIYERIEKELGLVCGMALPHKFKIVISGCPNACTRPQVSEIGIHGQTEKTPSGARAGLQVYLGGCGGRTPRDGIKLDRILTEDEAMKLIKKVVDLYRAHAKPRQRLGLLIEEYGKEKFLKDAGI